MKKDTLWVRWVHHIYLRGDASPWLWNSVRDDSPLLKRLIAIRDRVCHREGSIDAAKRKFASWEVGDHLNISLGYDYFRNRGSKLPWPSVIWNAYVTPKHAFTLWLASRKRLPTKDRLSFLHLEDSCVLCVGNRESAEHLFFRCTFSSLVWARIRHWLDITRAMSTISSALRWIRKEARGSTCRARAKRVALACSVYHIWTARNRKIFDGQAQVVEETVFRIKLHVSRVLFSLYPQNSVEF